MAEDFQLRMYLARKLMQIRYGDTYGIEADQAAKAWPPTGDADPSMEAGLLAMAVAARGGTPISSYTTQERIQNDLDESFDVKFVPYAQPPVWAVHRKLSACPHCRGSGWVRMYDEGQPASFDVTDSSLATATVTTKTVKCEHRPA